MPQEACSLLKHINEVCFLLLSISSCGYGHPLQLNMAMPFCSSAASLTLSAHHVSGLQHRHTATLAKLRGGHYKVQT